MTEAHEDLDARIERVDPDRWLATRFIDDPDKRADVLALYALNDELARIPSAVTQPMLGEIRFAWWREAIEDVFEGRMPRAHPVTLALSTAIKRRGLPRPLLEALVDARERDLDPAPFADAAEALDYVDRTAGALAALAAKVLDTSADPHAVRSAARAWGLAGLHRLAASGGP
ncbi:squalene/phytoene synthase family protein, partial [Caulobacter sp. 17J65-9]|uniref:phytoene/squalene synthase family protein n=1 Tax=Caulobacter sp. 17J65-9 TaxID=2709382 RepID=UPI0013CA30F4